MGAAPKDDATALELETLLFCRELPNASWTATAVADPSLVAFGSRDGAVAEHEQFLAEHLVLRPPVELARFAFPADVALHVVRVPLPVPGAGDRRPLVLDVAVACITVPQRRDRWVLVPAVAHTFYAPAGEDFEELVRREVARVVAARELDGAAFLRLLPAEDHELVPLVVPIEHGGEGIVGRAASIRRRRLAEHARKKARETLDEIGAPLHEDTDDRPAPVIVGRERPLRELGALLGGMTRHSVVLAGEPSAGKSTLFRAWLHGPGRGETVYATSGAQLVAGASGFGEWQARVVAALDAAELLDAVLYFENLAELFGERPERGGVDIAGVMRRYVVEGRVRVVGEITPEVLAHVESREVALFGATTRVRVDPLDARTSARALAAHIEHWAQHEPARPRVDPSLVEPVIELAERYMPYRAFPGKAVRFVDELRAARDGDRDPSGDPPVIRVTDAYDAFSVTSGIPTFLLRDDRALLAPDVERRFRRRIIGQAEAVRRVAETLCVVKARLQPQGKPLATFLFVGPTGVGKTELARTLADFLFGSPERMTRFDMSEYTDPLAAERLIRGTERDQGLLTGKVREQPFCVLLLDEIEKAHPAVFDLLLQVCGEGRLTDARGRTTFFHNAIIIMTSNLGAAHRRSTIGIAAAEEAADDYYMRAVRKSFRPEFINRLDRVIAFDPLTPAEVERVTEIAVGRLVDRRGLVENGVTACVSPGALAALAAGGYSETYGVRALRRHLDDALVTPIARLLARLGSEAAGGYLWAGATGEDGAPGRSAKQRIVAEDHGALRLELYRRPDATGRRATRGVQRIALDRFLIDERMAMDRVTAVRDHIAFLTSQMATAQSPRKRRKSMAASGAAVARLQTEFHRLSTAWDPCAALQADLHAAEELALAALFEGEDAGRLADEAAEVVRRFHAAFFYLLTAQREARDQVALTAFDTDGSGPLAMWLGGLLDEAERRGWSADVHVPRDKKTPRDVAGGAWPRQRAWSPPHAIEWARDQLVDEPGRHSGVLLRVRGKNAGLLLPMEGGYHRFEGWHSEPRHLHVRALALRAELTDDEWVSPELDRRPSRPTRATALARKREKKRDAVEGNGGWAVHVGADEYWPRFEEIATEYLLAAIHGGWELSLWGDMPFPVEPPPPKPKTTRGKAG